MVDFDLQFEEPELHWARVPLWLVDAGATDRAFVVYVGLHKWRNTTTSECRPSHKTIAKYLDRSVATVRRGLDDLEEIGAVQVTRRAATNDEGNQVNLPNIYKVIYTNPVANLQQGGITSEQPPLQERAAPPCTSEQPLPAPVSNKPDEGEPDEGKPEITFDERFEALWASKPEAKQGRHVRTATRKRIEKAIKGGATWSQLQSAMTNWAMSRRNEDPMFCMAAQKFYGPDEHWREYATDALEPKAESPPPAGQRDLEQSDFDLDDDFDPNDLPDLFQAPKIDIRAALGARPITTNNPRSTP